MKQLILIALFNFVTFCTFAQDTTINKQLIKPNQIYVSCGTFICNNRIYPFAELKNKLATNPEAYKEYNKYESAASWDAIGVLPFFLGLIGGAATLGSKNNLSGKIILGSLVPTLICASLGSGSRKHLNKAAAAYNKQF